MVLLYLEPGWNITPALILDLVALTVVRSACFCRRTSGGPLNESPNAPPKCRPPVGDCSFFAPAESSSSLAPAYPSLLLYKRQCQCQCQCRCQCQCQCQMPMPNANANANAECQCKKKVGRGERMKARGLPGDTANKQTKWRG